MLQQHTVYDRGNAAHRITENPTRDQFNALLQHSKGIRALVEKDTGLVRFLWEFTDLNHGDVGMALGLGPKPRRFPSDEEGSNGFVGYSKAIFWADDSHLDKELAEVNFSAG